MASEGKHYYWHVVNYNDFINFLKKLKKKKHLMTEALFQETFSFLKFD